MNDRVEIWSAEAWKKQMEVDSADFASLAQTVLGNKDGAAADGEPS